MIFHSYVTVYQRVTPPIFGARPVLRTKACCELMINDYTRRNFLDGRVARLPTVIPRPEQWDWAKHAWDEWMRSYYLVGGLEHFSHILGIVIPIHKYFSEGLKPPTSYHCQHCPSGDYCYWCLITVIFIVGLTIILVSVSDRMKSEHIQNIKKTWTGLGIALRLAQARCRVSGWCQWRPRYRAQAP